MHVTVSNVFDSVKRSCVCSAWLVDVVEAGQWAQLWVALKNDASAMYPAMIVFPPSIFILWPVSCVCVSEKA